MAKPQHERQNVKQNAKTQMEYPSTETKVSKQNYGIKMKEIKKKKLLREITKVRVNAEMNECAGKKSRELCRG